MLLSNIILLAISSAANRRHDQDQDRTTCEIVQLRGFPCEIHPVATYDGYIVELHRIPNPNGKPVVLVPGLVGNSAEFVMATPEVSKDPKVIGRNMALELHKQGYDVWLTNNRGSKYGLEHLWLSPEDKQFWKFCFDDISKNDVPAFLDYVVRFTGQKKVHVIGHSQGTSVVFALLSQDHRYNQIIETFIAISPITRIKNAKTLFKRVISILQSRFKRNGGPVFTRKSPLSGHRVGLACELPVSRQVCVVVYSLVIGPNFKQLDKKRIGVYTGHMPTTTAAQNLVHFHQVFKTNRFQKFDHGSEEKNLIKYGSPEPPEYDLKRITHPNIYLIYGLNDFYMSEDGVEHLKADLKNAREFYKLSDPKANHMDPLIGITTAVEVNRKVIGILSRYP